METGKKRKILVTGGCGFIGSHIVTELVSKGHEVMVLDNLSTGSLMNLDHLGLHPNLEIVIGDIQDLKVCMDVTEGVESVCHQAALGSVPRSMKDPVNSHLSNVTGFLNVLEACRQRNIKRFVYASSSSVYGDDQRTSKTESSTGNVLSPYACTKAIDELYAGVYAKCYGLETIGLRYFNIFGPRQDPDGPYAAVIPKFTSLLHAGKSPTINGDGLHSRDFTHVSNAVHANILALDTDQKGVWGRAFNVGSGGNISVKTLYNKIAELLKKQHIQPKKGEERPGDVRRSSADLTESSRELGYRVITGFETGLKDYISNTCRS